MFISRSSDAVAALPTDFVDDTLLAITLRFVALLCERSLTVCEPLPVEAARKTAVEVEAVQ